MKIDDIAKICHQANKAYCEIIGDYSQPQWEQADLWQKNSTINGVVAKLKNPDMTPEQAHENWCKYKRAEGWVHGPTKSTNTLTHPNLVPFKDLPEEQKIKDYIFTTIVSTLRPYVEFRKKPPIIKEPHPDEVALKMDEDSKPEAPKQPKKRKFVWPFK